MWKWAIIAVLIGVGCANQGRRASATVSLMPQDAVAPVIARNAITVFKTNQLRSVVAPTAGITVVPKDAALAWSPSADAVVAYNLYYGTESREYLGLVQAGNNTNCSVSLIGGATYYFAATAVDTDGNESDFSEEAVFTPRLDLDINFTFNEPVVNVSMQSSSDLTQWNDTDIVPVNGIFRVSPKFAMEFYRGVAESVSP